MDFVPLPPTLVELHELCHLQLKTFQKIPIPLPEHQRTVIQLVR